MAELLISVSFLAASKQSSALAMHPFEFKVTSEKHKLLLKKCLLCWCLSTVYSSYSMYLASLQVCQFDWKKQNTDINET